MSRVMHMCVDIKGYLESHRNRSLRGMFKHEDGSPYTDSESRDHLYDELRRGRSVLPLGAACDGFDYDKGCPGHEKEETP